MNYTIENLGVAGYGASNDDSERGAVVRRPGTGEELTIHARLEYGFTWVDLHTLRSGHIIPEDPLMALTCRGATQGMDGLIYQAGCRVDPASGEKRWFVLVWDWKTTGARATVPLPEGYSWIYRPEAAPDGTIFYGGTEGVPVFRFDPRTGVFKLFSKEVQYLVVAPDGFLYMNDGDHISRIDPVTAARTPVRMADGSPCPVSELKRDGAGRVIVTADARRANGRVMWVELVGGRGVPVEAATVRLTQTIISSNDLGLTEPDSNMLLPYVLADGTYVSRVLGTEITRVDPAGGRVTFTMERKPSPLRLFSIEACAGRLWLGTVLPLQLISYDPATNHFTNHGNPTPTLGEVYNMVDSRGRLYLTSYPRAYMTRYDPDRPWRLDRSVQANPAQFGMMKVEGLPVYRPHGRAIDPAGNVYFAAFGDYGCEDSAFCRIDAQTEAVMRRIHPLTTLGAIVYLPQIKQVLACEIRKDEKSIRFTFLCPENGDVLASEPMIHDHGLVTSWLHDGGDLIYGLHDYRATMLAYSLSQRKIVATLPELGLGEHLKNCLVFGDGGDIWGLTDRCVFAVDRGLKSKRVIAEYEDLTRCFLPNHSRFGAAFGPDGHLYFVNGFHLMRLRRGKS